MSNNKPEKRTKLQCLDRYRVASGEADLLLMECANAPYPSPVLALARQLQAIRLLLEERLKEE